MKFFATLLVICMSLTLIAAQRFFPFPAGFNFNPLGAAAPIAPSGIRDARNDRGPVLFPQSPPSPLDMSSGVIVGASGFGFVPPQQQIPAGAYYTSSSTDFHVPIPSEYTAFNYFRSPYAHQFTLI